MGGRDTVAPPLFELRGVSKSFGAVRALRDVSLGLRWGAVTALCGENGAGKSTLAAVCAGLLRPDYGELRLDGLPVVFDSPADAHKSGIRIAPQELVLCPNLSVAENICLGDSPGRGGIIDRSAMRAVATERLDRLGHPISPEMLVGDLTIVEKAFVQVARAIAPGERVLIVDEPTAPMSSREADLLMSMIQRLAADGLAIVYVSHRLDEVFRLADDVVVLRDGQLIASWPRRDTSPAMLVRAMVGDRDLTLADRRERQDGEEALIVDNLRYRAVHDVSFTLRFGEILAVYGILGSGREDLGVAVVGAVKRGAGRVVAKGRVLKGFHDAISSGIGYVPPERRAQGLVLGMSVRENLTLAMLSKLAPATVMRSRRERVVAQAWIRRLAIATPTSETPVGFLSGGSQQKVLLGRWLAAEKRVLVLEEPTRGVDVATKAEIYRLLRLLADGGGAILIISGDVQEVVAVGDRVLVLRGGTVAAEFTGADETTVAEVALLETNPQPAPEQLGG